MSEATVLNNLSDETLEWKANFFEKKSKRLSLISLFSLSYAIGTTFYIVFLVIYCRKSEANTDALIKVVRSAIRQNAFSNPANSRSHCENGWTFLAITERGFCYKMFQQSGVKQAEAKLACDAQRSSLVSIESYFENNFVYILGEENSAINKIWIGLEYDLSVKRRLWLDGTPSPYRYFYWENETYVEPEINTATSMCIRCSGIARWYVSTNQSDPQINGFVCKKKAQ
ncbi:unnamed protein product, partial [Mesorhabditis belari]|uniref:C-type lectin domain-containing protein n=1 Tax=Mesorhabditis belari TaxID=2138241 RepID=A0AAF3EBZ0_9BILA